MNSEQKIVRLHLIYETEKIMCFRNVCTFVRLRHTVFHFESFKHQTFNNQPYVASWQRASKEAKLCGLKQECVEAEV